MKQEDRKEIQLLLGSAFVIKTIHVLIAMILICGGAFGQSTQSRAGLTFSNNSITGSTTSWTNVTLAGNSDDLYAIPVANLPATGNYTDYLMVTNFQFAIPAGSTILGITLTVERSDANGKSKDSKVQIIKGGVMGTVNKKQSSAWSSCDTGKRIPTRSTAGSIARSS